MPAKYDADYYKDLKVEAEIDAYYEALDAADDADVQFDLHLAGRVVKSAD